MSHVLSPAAQRRRTVRRVRLALLAFVVGYFFLPYDIRAYIPLWLPFLVALGLEANFFVAGYLGPAGRTAPSDRGPQARDLQDFGGERWRETHTVVDDVGEEHVVPVGGLSDEEAYERVLAYLDDPETARAEDEAPPPLVEPVGFRARHPVASRLAEGLAALAVFCGLLYAASRPQGWDAVSTADRARAEALFSREAGAIAGHRVSVRCDTSGRHVGYVQDADGVAVVGGEQAYLVPGICDTLYQLGFKHRVHSFSHTARAIAVLAHESWHLRGVSDEGLANCYGFQSGVRIGTDLGLSEGKARAMMREQLATNASDSAADPQYLVPPGCRNGGAQDLNPGSSSFP